MTLIWVGVIVLPEGRLRWLVGVALAAALLRFAIIPWFEFQADQVMQLQTVSKRLDRSNKLIAAERDIEGRHALVLQKLQSLQRRFPLVESVGKFRVDVQQGISADAAQSGATVRSFDWVGEGALPPSQLQFVVARMELFGTLSALAKAQATIESNRPNLIVREVCFLGEVPANARDNTVGSLVIGADFFYRTSEP
jgi:hypothetical protein